jgi:carboxyl-terminal processing protease
MGPPVGQASKFGNLPEVAVEFRAQRLPENIGYLSFNAFLDAPRVMREFTKAIETFRDAEGLVIDLRGNMGGLMVLTMGMCGWFVEEPVDLGKMQMRGTALNLKLNPRSPRYEKPVAVLIDAVSISAAEVMAGGMQDAGTARLFGQRTAGLVLPSNVVRLANGDGLQYAMSDYHSLSGRTLEIEGVKPDVEVPLDQTVLSRGVDPVLEAAVQWIIATGRK